MRAPLELSCTQRPRAFVPVTGIMTLLNTDEAASQLTPGPVLISHRFRPYLRHLLRAVAGPATLPSASTHVEVVCPEEIAPLQPAIFLSGQLDRVKAPSR